MSDDDHIKLPEMVDLALCTPEVGTVNFNILRILLHEVIKKLKLDNVSVHLGDLESNHVQNYKNYIKGAGGMSPMPGVLRYNPTGLSYGVKSKAGSFESKDGHRKGDKRHKHQEDVGLMAPGFDSAAPSTPRDKKHTYVGGSDDPPIPVTPSGIDQETQAQHYQNLKTPKSGKPPSGRHTGHIDASSSDIRVPELHEKVSRLERHLEALYQLPTNQRLLHGVEQGQSMTVNDMWQIIQLNNRIAACEAAIQKMATLIEDLAKETHKMKTDSGKLKGETATLSQSNSQLSAELAPLGSKFSKTEADVENLKKSLDNLKDYWKNAVKKVEEATGVSIGPMPSTHKGTGTGKHKHKKDQSGRGKDEDTTSGPDSERQHGSLSTQTINQDGKSKSKGQGTKGGGKKTGRKDASEGDESTPEGESAVSTEEGKGKKGTKSHEKDGRHKGKDEEHELTESSTMTEVAAGGKKKKVQKKGEATGTGGEGEEEEDQSDKKHKGSKGGRTSSETGTQYDEEGHPIEGGADALSGEEEEGDEELDLSQKKGSKSKSKDSRSSQYEGQVDESSAAIEGGEEEDYEHKKKSSKGSTDKGTRTSRDDEEGKGKSKSTATGDSGEEDGEGRKKSSRKSDKATYFDADGRPVTKSYEGIKYDKDGHQIPDGDVAKVEMDGEDEERRELDGDEDEDMARREKKTKSTQASPAAKVGPDGQPLTQTKCEQMLRERCKQMLPCCPGEVQTQDGVAAKGVVQPEGPAPKHLEHGSLKSSQGDHHHHHHHHHRHSKHTKLVAAGTQSASAAGLGLMSVGDLHLGKNMKKVVEAFDENEVMQRIAMLTDAIKVLKHNEQTMTMKILKLDSVVAKIPTETFEKLKKIPVENLEVIASSNFDQVLSQTASRSKLDSPSKFDPITGSEVHGLSLNAKEDIQNLFNNLGNLLVECAEQKERLDHLSDGVRVMEAGMVTRQMLIDSLTDKADKGQVNTKVSYDEFGNTIDEIHEQLHSLLMEGYERNENWKKVASDLTEELSEKLDKVELAPIRAYFKNHLKNLEERVSKLTELIEAPDPAGTRRKLLRDYNCLSCDRHVNISGVTNAPLLPTIGPIPAGHVTASRRAFDLHRMRQKGHHCNTDARDLNLMEQQMRAEKEMRAARNCGYGDGNAMTDTDIAHIVSRYQGGSHTTLNTADRIASLNRAQDPSRLQYEVSTTNQQFSEPKKSSAGMVQMPSNVSGKEAEIPEMDSAAVSPMSAIYQPNEE